MILQIIFKKYKNEFRFAEPREGERMGVESNALVKPIRQTVS